MRPWGLTMWNRIGAVARYATQVVVKMGVYLLEVGFVIRDVLKTGFGKMRDGVRFVSGKVVDASKVVILPVWDVCKVVGGKIAGGARAVGSMVSRNCRNTYSALIK